MNYKHLEIPQKKISTLYKKSWELYKKNFFHIAIIIIAVYGPLGLISYYVDSNFDWLTSMQIKSLIEQLIAIVATLSIINLIIDVEGEWHSAVEKGFKSWGVMIVTNITALITLTLLSFLLIIPGLIWAVYYTFAVQVVVLNRLWGKKALDYSKKVVQGNWWYILGVEVLTFLILFIASIILMLPFEPLPEMYFSIIGEVILSLIMVFLPIVNTVLFIHLMPKSVDTELIDERIKTDDHNF
ncbi:hypothetical protein [Vallitalea okinawensis]|uniref:hypothetical protein n=1 Tax=Vallitalea okinawensis TaxID=2078660 RepID=UPI000CFCB0A2|nr:hypothetical protein [Vallitalea okinawensis]